MYIDNQLVAPKLVNVVLLDLSIEISINCVHVKSRLILTMHHANVLNQ